MKTNSLSIKQRAIFVAVVFRTIFLATNIQLLHKFV